MHRLFFVLILLIATNGFAADVTHLYQSEKAVLSQTEAERQTVSADVLRQVLLKVVGDASLLEKTDVSAILAQSNQLLQRYEYQRTNVIADDLTEPDRLELVLTFNKAGVNKALQAAGLPIWGASRPETLLWFAIEKGDSRTIMGADEQSKLLEALTDAAYDRGLPLLLPVMDLQDQSQVTFADISADFTQNIESASERYGAQVVLMALAHYYPDETLSIRWHALINGESEQWQSRGKTKEAVQAGINELSNRLSRRFAQIEAHVESTQTLSLLISEVSDYQDYTRIVNYLNKLQYASDVQVTNLSGNTLELSMKFSGDIAVFNRTIAIDRVLMKEPYSSTEMMNFRLLP